MSTAEEETQKLDVTDGEDASKSKKPSRKELKKQQKRNEYEKGLQAMGSKLHNLKEEDQTSLSKKGGIGSGAEVGDQFNVSQQVKTDAQLNLMETAVDIKRLRISTFLLMGGNCSTKHHGLLRWAEDMD
ncbi:hypothetical protein ACQ4LE_006506 [Meloidogyne hapla]